jgi:transcriptional regulator
MYDIPYFKSAHPEEVLEFMRAHPFALICGVDAFEKPVATQIPILFERRGDKLFLQGHFMKKQDHTNAFLQNANVLVIFTGPHSYVSASWYENKQVASTWNYQSVHVSGLIGFQDENFLRELLTRLTEKFESPDSPSLVQQMDPAYVQKMMQAIIGFEIEVDAVRHVFKLSQNRDEHSYANVISKLSGLSADAGEIAMSMKKRII